MGEAEAPAEVAAIAADEAAVAAALAAADDDERGRVLEVRDKSIFVNVYGVQHSRR